MAPEHVIYSRLACHSANRPRADSTFHDRRARMKAAERHTSLSALVKQFLLDLVKDEREFERLKREEAALRGSIRAFRASDRLERDQLHERSR